MRSLVLPSDLATIMPKARLSDPRARRYGPRGPQNSRASTRSPRPRSRGSSAARAPQSVGRTTYGRLQQLDNHASELQPSPRRRVDCAPRTHTARIQLDACVFREIADSAGGDVQSEVSFELMPALITHPAHQPPVLTQGARLGQGRGTRQPSGTRQQRGQIIRANSSEDKLQHLPSIHSDLGSDTPEDRDDVSLAPKQALSGRVHASEHLGASRPGAARPGQDAPEEAASLSEGFLVQLCRSVLQEYTADVDKRVMALTNEAETTRAVAQALAERVSALEERQRETDSSLRIIQESLERLNPDSILSLVRAQRETEQWLTMLTQRMSTTQIDVKDRLEAAAGVADRLAELEEAVRSLSGKIGSGALDATGLFK